MNITDILTKQIKGSLEASIKLDCVVYDDYAREDIVTILKNYHNGFVKYLSLCIKHAVQIKTKPQLLKYKNKYLFNMSTNELMNIYTDNCTRREAFKGMPDIIDNFLSNWCAVIGCIRAIDEVTSKYEEKYGVYEELFPQKEYPETHNRVYDRVLNELFRILDFDASNGLKINLASVENKLFDKDYNRYNRMDISHEMYQKYIVEQVIHNAFEKIKMCNERKQPIPTENKDFCVLATVMDSYPNKNDFSGGFGADRQEYETISDVISDLLIHTGAEHIIKDIMFFNKEKWYTLQDFDILSHKKFNTNCTLRYNKALEEYMELRCAVIDGITNNNIRQYAGIAFPTSDGASSNIMEELADYAVTNSELIFSGYSELRYKTVTIADALDSCLTDKIFITDTAYYLDFSIGKAREDAVNRDVILNVCDIISTFKEHNKELKKKTKV